MMHTKMKKTLLKVAVPVILLATTAGSFAISNNILLPNSQTKVIASPVNVVDNTIDMSQIRKLEGLKGVSNFFYYDGENQIAIGMNADRKQALESDLKENDLTEYYRNVYGDIHQVDISSLQANPVKSDTTLLKSLDAEFGAGYSPNGGFIDLVIEGKSCIYDIEKDKLYYYSDDELIGNWAEDSKTVVKYSDYRRVSQGKEDSQSDIYIEKRRFLTYDQKGQKVNEMVISDHVDWVDPTGFYSEDGKAVYFKGRVYDEDTLKTGLYKLDMTTGTIQDVISMMHSQTEKIKNPGTDLKEHPGEYLEVYKDSRVYDFAFLSNGNMIVDAMIDNITGLYLYDTNANTRKLLLEYEGGFNFKIAPDESKIVYTIDQPLYDQGATVSEQTDNKVVIESKNEIENNTNVYVANIGDDKLTNISYVKKNTFACDFKWSNDSKQLLFFEPYDASVHLVKFK